MTPQTSEIRPLTDTEIDDVTGGTIVLGTPGPTLPTGTRLPIPPEPLIGIHF